MRRTLPLVLLVPLALCACSSTGIALREQFGIAKREQLVDRVDETRDAQESAKEQFATTLDELRSLTGFEGGDLERAYDRLSAAFNRSKDRAARVRDRIDAVERVASALFREWEAELDEYADANLRQASERQLDDTRLRYDQLLRAMRRAEARMDPVLRAFSDQVLFLKHNLNARAIASLDATLDTLETDIDALIVEMEASIAEANEFIDEMSAG